jgi:membrane protein DedA with SNARE-associated domain
MDFSSGHEHLTVWLNEYGSVVLFVVLALGVIALPVPEETLMIIAGTLIRYQKLELVPTFASAYAGSLCGITVSFLLGRSVGFFLLTRYGKWVGITELRLMKAHYWYEKLGKWFLFIGYFIPGVRHFTGLCAGMAKLHFKYFALFAYTGGVVWVTLFLCIGYFFGHIWMEFFEELEWNTDFLAVILIGIACILIFLYLFKKYRRERKF